MQDSNKKFSGIVVALKANYLIVEIDFSLLSNKNFNEISTSNQKRILCTKRRSLSYKGSSVFVGDHVLIEQIDWINNRGVITDVEDRTTFISRPPLANFSDILVLISLKDPQLDFNQASNFLLKAEESEQKVTLILTKSDLVSTTILDQYLDQFLAWGYNAYPISIINGEGIPALYHKLSSINLGLLCGPSGSGKSSLINHLLPEASAPIGDLSKKLRRGKHKTRHVELFSLSNGSLLADTPGFNKPELAVGVYELPFLFPELRSQLATSTCKFRNCLHLDEPGCAISQTWERYEIYRNCISEIIDQNQ